MPRWFVDPVFWLALLVGLSLRALPMWLFGWTAEEWDCTRDECIYRIVSRPILEGEGLALAPKGWLPAPGYPYLLAWCQVWLGSMEHVKWVQWALTLPTGAVLYTLGARTSGRAAARWMAVGFALHPTLVFFVGTMWTETLYTLLLASTLLATVWARDGGWSRALVPGVLLGLTVLTRGVATYLAPLVLLVLVYPGTLQRSADWADALGRRARHGIAFVLATLLVVAPYSRAASQRWGGFVISDATLGHVVALGNDDYPPITFDYGIGQLTGKLYARTLSHGRGDCPRRLGPLDHDRCEVERATAWIAANPGTFVARVPVRLAQLLNPHSFLTRHVRWGFWPGLPWAAKELIVVYQALFTFAVVGLGTLAAWARARGPWGLLAIGTVGYHVGVIAALYGLTRFRLPLEPLWMVFLAGALADPRESWRLLSESTPRLVGAVLTVPIVTALMLRYAWTGFPGFGP